MKNSGEYKTNGFSCENDQRSDTFDATKSDKVDLGHRRYNCYIARKLSSYENSSDFFDQTYRVHFGGRLYPSESAKVFMTFSTVTRTITFPKKPDYMKQVEIEDANKAQKAADALKKVFP